MKFNFKLIIMRKILFSVAVIFIVVFLQGSMIVKSDNYKTTDSILISYKKDIVPIFQNSCTPCHFPPKGRKEPLDSYESVKNQISEIIIRVKLPKEHPEFMPYESKKPVLNDSLIVVLETWQKQNMPE